MLHQRNSKTFKHDGKTGMTTCPRNRYRLDTTRRTLTPWNAGSDSGLKLHGIQMSPTLFWSMVISGARLATNWTKNLCDNEPQPNGNQTATS